MSLSKPKLFMIHAAADNTVADAVMPQLETVFDVVRTDLLAGRTFDDLLKYAQKADAVIILVSVTASKDKLFAELVLGVRGRVEPKDLRLVNVRDDLKSVMEALPGPLRDDKIKIYDVTNRKLSDGVQEVINSIPSAVPKWLTLSSSNHKSIEVSQTTITNYQFEAFENDGGYSRFNLWRPDFSREWLTSGAYHNQVNENCRRDQDQGPRVCTTWYEAVAYSNWLAEKLDTNVRLPTERELRQLFTERIFDISPLLTNIEFSFTVMLGRGKFKDIHEEDYQGFNAEKILCLDVSDYPNGFRSVPWSAASTNEYIGFRVVRIV